MKNIRVLKNRKGQMGVASLVIAVIIALVITQTLNDSGLLGAESNASLSVTNETNAWSFGNGTLYLVNVENSTTQTYNVTDVWSTIDGLYNLQANGTFRDRFTISTAGLLDNSSTLGNSSTWDNISISYTYVYTFEGLPSEAAAAGNLTANFSEGINRVSEQISTVLLISAIVLIISILAVLVGVWQKMRMTGGGSL